MVASNAGDQSVYFPSIQQSIRLLMHDTKPTIKSTATSSVGDSRSSLPTAHRNQRRLWLDSLFLLLVDIGIWSEKSARSPLRMCLTFIHEHLICLPLRSTKLARTRCLWRSWNRVLAANSSLRNKFSTVISCRFKGKDGERRLRSKTILDRKNYSAIRRRRPLRHSKLA